MFCLTFVAFVLFVSEVAHSHITAAGVLVALVVLEPWTGIGARDAFTASAGPAVIPVVTMYALSEGIRGTGTVERRGVSLVRLTKGSESRLPGATVGLVFFRRI